MSRLFTSGGFSHWSFSFSNSPSNEVLFPLGLTGLISLMSKGLSKVFSSRIQKHQSFGAQPSLWSNSHIHTWLLEKPSSDYADFCRQSNVLLFNTVSRFVIAFLPKSKCLLISGLQLSCSHSDFVAHENKICHCFLFLLFLFAIKWWDWIPWS